MTTHFFADAPVLTWFEWLKRYFFNKIARHPSLISSNLSKTDYPISPTGVRPEKAKADLSYEYSNFISMYFYPPESPLKLIIPSCIIESGIKNAYIHGIEIRDVNRAIVGVIFCIYTGLYEEKSTGLITWMCVHPSWRKKGISNCLLRSIYIASQPKDIYWFRNDGWLFSTVPPVWTETRIFRKKNPNRVQGLKFTGNVRRVPYTKWQNPLKINWIQNNPTGLVLDDTSFQYRLLETWELQIGPQSYCVVLIQPTFECQRTANTEQWCEVITWFFYGQSKTEYEQITYIESILNHIPYTWIEAPKNMPHLENDWIINGASTSWSAFGLDTGVPVMRPILSLCTS